MGERGGGCCPPMDLFRSEPMQLVQLIIPVESAHLTVSYLGEVGLLQFKDVCTLLAFVVYLLCLCVRVEVYLYVHVDFSTPRFSIVCS